MNKRKINKTIILSLIGLIFVVALSIFILNYSKDDSSFSILEKKWINDNSSNVIDVSVYNDVPVFGDKGNGVIFDFLTNFTESYGIEFNKVSYFVSDNKDDYKDVSFKVLNNDVALGNNDILMYKDNYVLLSKDNKVIEKIEDLSNKTVGLLNNDLSNVSYFLNNASNVSYIPYVVFDEMILSLKNGDIDYVILPQNMYLNTIIENDLNVAYHFNDLFKKYVITVKDNETLYNIINKYNLQYIKDNYAKSYKTNLATTFFNSKKITDAEKVNYNANSYNYGYVINMPFENTENGEFVGTFSNYLSELEDYFDLDFKITKYNTIAELKQALSNGEIDAALNNFDTSGLKIDTINTNTIYSENYVVLSQDIVIMDSIRSLKDIEVYTVSNTDIYNFLKENSITVKEFKNTDDLLRHVGSDTVLVIDKETYNYYKSGKLANFNVLYENSLKKGYNFIIRDVNKNKTFSEIFKFYASFKNYNDVKYQYNTSVTFADTNVLGVALKYIFGALLIVLLVVLTILTFAKKKKKANLSKKEEKLKFIDIMTSLKNRNYLNYNVQKWEDNVIYPQSFVVIDLNNIKFINDNHGHEEGDNVIKKAASILIINQLEKTDIMRTDGNEFLVYMVGYDEKKVVEYTRKIYKELKELPYGFGASIGYSMITDDVKTIDDAINEATLEMRNAKEKL